MQYHIFSPYRVCPLGAHVDHQHGLVTGFAIDKGVDLWFDVREDSKVILDSETFTGHVEFDIAMPTLENPLETDPGIPLVIDPPILFFSSDSQMQAVGIKNRSSQHSA